MMCVEKTTKAKNKNRGRNTEERKHFSKLLFLREQSRENDE
jgi:hypothetical protein